MGYRLIYCAISKKMHKTPVYIAARHCCGRPYILCWMGSNYNTLCCLAYSAHSPEFI